MAEKKFEGYFEDFDPAKVWDCPSRTITEADAQDYMRISGDYNQIYTNEDFAKNTAYGGKVICGLLAFGMATGLWARLGVLNQVIAGLDQSWKFPHHAKIGDTITVRLTFPEKKETKNPERGIVKRVITITNQKGEVVAEGEGKLMFRRRPKA